jgi:hypothetical protein
MRFTCSSTRWGNSVMHYHEERTASKASSMQGHTPGARRVQQLACSTH